MLDFYKDVGPTGYLRYFLQPTGSQFGVEGFLVMLVGCQLEYQNRYQAPPQEREYFEKMRNHYRLLAEQRGMDVSEALSFVHHPQWKWHGDKS